MVKISGDVGTSCIHFVGRPITNEHRGPNWLAMAIAAKPCFSLCESARRPATALHSSASLRRREPDLMGDQFTFQGFAESVAGQRAIAADHTVARNNETNGIGGIRPTDRARGIGIANFNGELSVATGLAEGDALERSPDTLLERRAARGEFHCEGLAFLGKIFGDFSSGVSGAHRILLDLICREAFAEFGQAAESCGDDGAAGIQGDGEVADGGREGVVKLSHGGVGRLNCHRWAVARLR